MEQRFRMLGSVLPAQAYDVVIEQIHRISAASGGTLGWGLALSFQVWHFGAPMLARKP